MGTIRTVSRTFTTPDTFDAAVYRTVKDISILNPESSIADAYVSLNGSEAIVLAAGDPILSLGGYEGMYRDDRLDISFGGGTAKLLVFYGLEIIPNKKNCD